MDKTVTLTPVVARALEERRRQLDSELDGEAIMKYVASSLPNAFDGTTRRLVGEFKQRCRELGALDEVCVAHGITEYVESTEVER